MTKAIDSLVERGGGADVVLFIKTATVEFGCQGSIKWTRIFSCSRLKGASLENISLVWSSWAQGQVGEDARSSLQCNHHWWCNCRPMNTFWACKQLRSTVLRSFFHIFAPIFGSDWSSWCCLECLPARLLENTDKTLEKKKAKKKKAAHTALLSN